MQKQLIIGYGNPDRQDDGVAWHILKGVMERIGREGPDSFEEGLFPTGENPDFLFTLQLVPEIAETVAEYDRVCFVDAHTGNVEQDVNLESLSREFTQSPFTHHMTPQTCLHLVETIYKSKPEAILASVRGYEFAFSHTLSSRTSQLSLEAINRIVAWLYTTH